MRLRLTRSPFPSAKRDARARPSRDCGVRVRRVAALAPYESVGGGCGHSGKAPRKDARKACEQAQHAERVDSRRPDIVGRFLKLSY